MNSGLDEAGRLRHAEPGGGGSVPKYCPECGTERVADWSHRPCPNLTRHRRRDGRRVFWEDLDCFFQTCIWATDQRRREFVACLACQKVTATRDPRFCSWCRRTIQFRGGAAAGRARASLT